MDPEYILIISIFSFTNTVDECVGNSCYVNDSVNVTVEGMYYRILMIL